LFLNHLVQAANRPQVRFITKSGSRPQNDGPKLFFPQFFQHTWATAARPAFQSVLAIPFKTSQPTVQRSGRDAERIRSGTDRPSPLHRLHGPNANRKGRVTFLAHESELCDNQNIQSISV
jgi:hypothetical protein